MNVHCPHCDAVVNILPAFIQSNQQRHCDTGCGWYFWADDAREIDLASRLAEQNARMRDLNLEED